MTSVVRSAESAFASGFGRETMSYYTRPENQSRPVCSGRLHPAQSSNILDPFAPLAPLRESERGSRGVIPPSAGLPPEKPARLKTGRFMLCPGCGKLNSREQKECRHCGGDLFPNGHDGRAEENGSFTLPPGGGLPVDSEPGPTAKRCPHCGGKNSERRSRCVSCGEALEAIES